ncbi:Receptor-type guanylate cyclase gcy-22 [Caenorhabditis elegans]|uniref:Isoform c of Receptor-type guanylate cyclase gcy-22 n=1 Tax=Caenorhabditis elegans TaxID=6239 RepID=Q9XTY1-3|nr:Receptor-type guanylate cyclase gcy-22 [Caenorhabditis elegans]CCM09401.1 Receptor-type guanylate cyclase gcy-22 [Caenorhabditis elegans]|eukprot:NP_001263951.1 Receptor-type guanylate cyclase gcy-22 [Caenorhabditis elegans]
MSFISKCFICLLFSTYFLPPVNSAVLQVGFLAANDNTTELAPFIGWGQVAGALGVAWSRIVEYGLLPGYETMNLTWVLTNCREADAVGSVINYAEGHAHVVLGPPCVRPAQVAGSVAKYLDFPLILWGPPFDSSLLNQFEYPTIASTTSSTLYQATSLIRLLEYYKWTEIALIYYVARSDLIPRCTPLISDFEGLVNNNDNLTITYRRQMSVITNTSYATALRNLKELARVVIVCLESDEARRNLMISISENGMDGDEYVYIMAESRRAGFASSFWNGTDGKNDLALRAARKFLVMDNQKYNDTTTFVQEVRAAFSRPPFSCPNCTNIDPTVSQVGPLGDALLLYAYALNRSIATGNPNPTGTEFCEVAKGMEFLGFTGKVIINQNSTRTPLFVVYNLDSTDKEMIVMQITEDLDDSKDPITLVATPAQIWDTWGGTVPLSTPICGFTGTDCPKSFTDQYLAIILGCTAAALVLIIAVISTIVFLVRSKRQEEERLNQLWQVHFSSLVKPPQKNTMHSSRSLQSTVTTSTKVTINSKKDTERHSFYFLNNDSVVARKHNFRATFTKNDRAMFRKMRNVDNDNLCKFIGLSLDSPTLISIWRYCSRGSLQDVIAKGSLQMDWFFKYSLMRDVADAIYYLHHSPIGPHGWLSSSTCLVDERWQVKVSFFGLSAIKQYEVKEQRDFLHTAPEHIRDTNLPITKEMDIYSFAIICSELITKKSAWDLENETFDIEELVYKIKKGGRSPPRPSLETEDEHNGSMSLLVRDCWNENPDQRPTSEQIKTLMKSMNHNRSSNLMDHVFNVLEQYASNLEDEVQARMKELTEEKKRSDVLLYRMLPKQVAEKLKLGQSVEPETFDCVTIFFSDVVSFTTLASRCTPLQVVNLLNDLYTTFDAIIEQHDVYKVETIGDGYLCVSGLPHRNGNEHAKEISSMSFSLLKAIKTFRVPHLPKERINIRVGLHTGPVVTGVVGMTMPRYCLFGDSVNTASRMESNGKPGRVHISTECMKFLTEVIGGYQTEPRGEVIVKGKGAVQTHWLLTDDEIEAKENGESI